MSLVWDSLPALLVLNVLTRSMIKSHPQGRIVLTHKVSLRHDCLRKSETFSSLTSSIYCVKIAYLKFIYQPELHYSFSCASLRLSQQQKPFEPVIELLEPARDSSSGWSDAKPYWEWSKRHLEAKSPTFSRFLLWYYFKYGMQYSWHFTSQKWAQVKIRWR